MTLELIVFIAAILLGIVLYWRESNSNKLYRFFNKIINSKELQMKPTDKTGFVYQQTFLLRLVFISFLFLIGIVITRFLIPIDLATISIFASMIVGTILGTYLANFVFKSSEVIDEKSDSLEDVFHETIEKQTKRQNEPQKRGQNQKRREPCQRRPQVVGCIGIISAAFAVSEDDICLGL